jgi:hypothetical protein
MEHHPMTLIEKRLRRRAAETVRITRDENERHLLSSDCNVQPTEPGDGAIHHPSNLSVFADTAGYRDRLVTCDICSLPPPPPIFEVRENDEWSRAGERLCRRVPFQMPPL